MAPVDSYFVTRTMQTLEVLAFQPASAAQIADVLRVDARTARRLLNRLTDEGWLTRTEGRARRYTLSLRLVALAAHFAERAPLARAALPVIDALHERTRAAAHLCVPSYRSVLCMVHRAGQPAAPPALRELVPAHACAAGKMLLAHRERWRESVLELPLERLTERTITDRDALRRECERARERGLARERGEYRDGVAGVAAPVHAPSGEVVATVGVTGPGDAPTDDAADAVRAAAAALRAALAVEADDRAA
jgi:DNA-binding IclR family transcriptional regulator